MPADVQQLIDSLEGCVHDDGTSRFGGDVAVLTKRDPYRGGRQGGGVVDAIAQEKVVASLGLPANDLQLLLRRLSRVNVLNADLICQIPYLRFPVAGYEQHPAEAVFGPEMLDERSPLDARLVAEAKRGRVAVVDQDHTLHPTARGRKSLHQLGLLGRYFLPARDLNGVTGHSPPEAFPGPFTDGGGFLERQAGCAGRLEDGSRERV